MNAHLEIILAHCDMWVSTGANHLFFGVFSVDKSKSQLSLFCLFVLTWMFFAHPEAKSARPFKIWKIVDKYPLHSDLNDQNLFHSTIDARQ